MLQSLTQSLAGRKQILSFAILVFLSLLVLLNQDALLHRALASKDLSPLAAAPGWQWAAQAGGGNPESGHGVAQDLLGNVYVTGNFSLTASFGNLSVTSNGGDDAFVAKYNSAGAPQWVRHVGGSEFDSGNDLAVDAAGNVYVAGSFSGTATFGNSQLTSSGARDGFVVKYDSAGVFQWARQIGGSGDDFAQGLGVDPAGNVYATGVFNGSLTFGNTTLTSSGGADVFIVKFDTGGNPQWAQRGGGPNDDLGWDAAADAAGNVFVSGRFLVSAAFGSTTLTSAGLDDIFVAKYNSAGVLQWAKQAGSPSSDDGYGVGADGAGGCYVTGRFGGVQGLNGTFGSITLTSSGGSDIFVAKYDAAGNVVWAERSGGAANDEGRSVEADAAGNAYLTGVISGTATFGNTTVTSNGPSDLFIAKYSTTGIFQWVQQTGNSGSDEGQAISVDPQTACLAVTGRFSGTVSFGSISLTANNTDALVARTTCNCSRRPLSLFNTSSTADGLGLLAPGEVDPHYVLLNTSPLFPDAIVLGQSQIPSAWLPNGPNSQWLGPNVNPLGSSPVGFYTYRATFNLADGCDPSTAVIVGQWATDNEAEIFLNGQSTGQVTGPADFAAFTPFMITSGFASGVNHLDFRVRNRGVGGGTTPTATGLRVELNGSVVCCACVAPPSGLVNWWPFDETSGTTAQDIRGLTNNVGTYMNGPTPVPGIIGGALSFDGVDDFVEAVNDPELNFFGGCSGATEFAEPLTIDVWVKTNLPANQLGPNSGLMTILDKRATLPTINGYHLFLFNGRLGFQIDGTNFVAPASGPQYVDVADNHWHFVAVSLRMCRGGGGQLYVDGNPVMALPAASGFVNTANLFIGGRDPAFGPNFFKGALDELEIFKRALTDDEVRALFEARSGGKCFRQPCPAITINPATLVNQTWAVNMDYPVLNLSATGGAGPYTFTVSGGLPPGMGVEPDGTLHGKPTTPGTYTFTVTVADANGCLSVREYRIIIINCPALTLNPAAGALPPATINVPYSQTFTTTGGCSSPFTYALTGGNLPLGLTLDGGGLLTGLPIQPGDFTFTVTVTDACGCATSNTYTLKVECPTQLLRLFNTGLNADGSALLTPGQIDPHYTLLNTSPVSPNAVAIDQNQMPSVWLANGPNSVWIGPRLDPNTGSPGGFYTYHTTFELSENCDLSSIVITGKWASDNESEIFLNEQTTGQTNGPSDFGALKPFVINSSNSTFKVGLNTLDFKVRNRPVGGTQLPTATGLRVELSGTVKCCLCVAPPASLVDWWTFDETTGTTANDIRGVNNSGVYHNGPTPSPGKVATALCFDGVDDYVEVGSPNHPEINFLGVCTGGATAESFTIDAWVRTSESTNLQVILDKRATPSQPVGYHLFLFNGRLGFQMNGVNFVEPAGPNRADGNWNFIAVTVTRCQGAIGKLYVNGLQVHTFTPPTGSLENSGQLWIGRRDPAFPVIEPTFFKGCLDELEIFKRALAPSELQAIFAAGSAGKCKADCSSLTLSPTVLTVPLEPQTETTVDELTNIGVESLGGGALPTENMGPTDRVPESFTCPNPRPLPSGTAGAAYVGGGLGLAQNICKAITVGAPYSQTFTAAGGCGMYTFSVTGALPPGLSLSSDGVLSGTPTQPGENFFFMITVTDACGCSKTQSYCLRVCPQITITLQPSSRKVCLGDSATFTAAATSSQSLTVQWQVSTDGGQTFTNIPGAINPTLTATTPGLYRAVFTGSCGSTVATTAASLSNSLLPCNINTTALTFPASGGSGSVNVTAPEDTAWTASSRVSWVTITSGNSGLGNGTVNFAVAANPDPTSRTGLLDIAGKTFTITQAAANNNCVPISIATALTGTTGSSLTVPIMVGDLTGKGVTAFDFTLTFDPAVVRLQSTPLSSTGTLSSGFTVTANANTPNKLVVSAFGTTPLAGAGTLLNLKFDLIGAVSACSNLTWTSFTFNEGTPCVATSNGRICIVGGTISGAVNYATSATLKAVPGVIVTAAGTPSATSTTNSAGAYNLASLGGGPYTVTPTKTGDVNGISAFDASLVAQHAAGLITLTANQQIAGDASGNGTLSAFDASLIAQTAAGIPNSGLAGTWKFVPANRTYPTLAGNQTNQNFDAVLVGDVSGNWAPPAIPPPTAASSRASQAISPVSSSRSSRDEAPSLRPAIKVSVPPASGASGATVTLPIRVGDLTKQNIKAYQFTLTFDPQVLQLASAPVAEAGTLSRGMSIVTNTSVPGRVTVVAFQSTPLAGKGTLLNLTFNVLGAPGSSTALTFTPQGVAFNEGHPATLPVNGSFTVSGSGKPVPPLWK